MAKKKLRDVNEGIRRFLTDFRSHTERRSFDERRVDDRRTDEGTVDDDRRGSDDRRDAYDRREMLLERRRGTSEWFIREHVERIREALLNSRVEVTCPRCGGDLLLGPAVQRGTKSFREVHCTACRHHVVIADVPMVSEDCGGHEG